MKYIISIILILFGSFADIFLFKMGIIPVQPSSFLIPFFLVVCAIKYPVIEILEICKSHTFKIFAIFIFFAIVFASISPASSQKIIEEIVLNIITILLYVYMVQFFRTESKFLVSLVCFGAFAVLAISVWYDYFVGLPKFSEAAKAMVRKGGFGENPNQAASALKFLALTILIFLQKKKINRILFIVVMVSSVFMTFSRSGIISVMLILILGTSNGWVSKFNISPQKLFKSLFQMILLFSSLYIALIMLVGVLRTEFPELARGAMGDRIDLLLGQSEGSVIAEDVGTGGGRGDLLLKFLDDFKQYPFGYGTAYSSDQRYNPLNTHNIYLFIAVNFGIIALLLYLIYLAKSVSLSFKNNQFYHLIFIVLLMFEGLVTHHLFYNRSILITLAFFDSLIYLNPNRKQV
ncbi:O-antigen ligase family protein [Winogradskyella sp.]|nr:O-antigen ligase family protein [Winogradskyella sp.]MDC1505328.1 O-antigen ligase family protein [Winogradskyella sp.]